MFKKSEIMFLLLCVAFVVFLVLPTARNLSDCFKTSDMALESVPAPLKEGKDAFCKAGQENMNTIFLCIGKSKARNPVSSALLYFKSSTINKTVDKHNQVCPEYPISQL